MMKKKALMFAATAMASVVSTSALAATIDFESGTAGTAIGSTYAGVTFSNAFFATCGGGCPVPEFGQFASSSNFASPFTATFAALQSSVSFVNVSNSTVTASAFDSLGVLLDSVSSSEGFPISGAALTLTGTGISYVTFSGPQYGIDDLTFAAGVPEPASWALMIAGVGLAGGALRRRRSVKTSVSFA